MTPLNGSPTNALAAQTNYDTFRDLYFTGVTDPIQLARRLQLSIKEVNNYIEKLVAEAAGDH